MTLVAIVRALISSAAIAHGVSVPFADEVARCESTYRPEVISLSGARGLYQLMPGGKLEVFYAFFMEMVNEGQMWAWTCAQNRYRLLP